MCFGYSKELSHWDVFFWVRYPQYMFWLRNKKNNLIFRYTLLSGGLIYIKTISTQRVKLLISIPGPVFRKNTKVVSWIAIVCHLHTIKVSCDHGSKILKYNYNFLPVLHAHVCFTEFNNLHNHLKQPKCGTHHGEWMRGFFQPCCPLPVVCKRLLLLHFKQWKR